MILKIKMDEEFGSAWQCTVCGPEKCVLFIPGTPFGAPSACPIKLDTPEWKLLKED